MINISEKVVEKITTLTLCSLSRVPALWHVKEPSNLGELLIVS